MQNERSEQTGRSGRMTAEEFLRSVREAKMEQARCEARLAALSAQTQRLTASYGTVPKGGSADRHRDDAMIAVAEQVDEVLAASAKYLQLIGQVERFVIGLPDARHRAVLRLRYVDGLKWTAVAEGLKAYGLYYDMRQVFRLHGDALASARRLYETWEETET